MVVVPFPSTLPAAVAQALADVSIGSTRRGLLLRLCGDDIDNRASALLELMEFESVDDGLDNDDGDGGDDVDVDDDGAGRRLVPALVALAESRDGPEQFSLLTCAAQLELGRLLEEEDVDDDLAGDWSEACLTALRLAAAAVAQPLEDDLLRPLLLVLATFNGNAELGLTIAGGLDDDEDDDLDDLDEDEDEDDDLDEEDEDEDDLDDEDDDGDEDEDEDDNERDPDAEPVDLSGVEIFESEQPPTGTKKTQVVARVGVAREPGFLYYLGLSHDGLTPIMRVQMVRGGEKRPSSRAPEAVAALRHEREAGWLYFLDRDGNVARSRMSRSG